MSPTIEDCGSADRCGDGTSYLDKLMLCRGTRVFLRHRSPAPLSFPAWRQQACLVAALPKLTAGESVTSVAMAFGYDNPAAFTTMFKRLLGVPPRTYLAQG
jgi:AraC-like DNA-binding protein